MNDFDLIAVELYTDGKPFILCIADEERNQMLVEASGTFVEAKLMLMQVMVDILSETQNETKFEFVSSDLMSAVSRATKKVRQEKYHGKH